MDETVAGFPHLLLLLPQAPPARGQRQPTNKTALCSVPFICDKQNAPSISITRVLSAQRPADSAGMLLHRLVRQLGGGFVLKRPTLYERVMMERACMAHCPCRHVLSSPSLCCILLVLLRIEELIPPQGVSSEPCMQTPSRWYARVLP